VQINGLYVADASFDQVLGVLQQSKEVELVLEPSPADLELDSFLQEEKPSTSTFVNHRTVTIRRRGTLGLLVVSDDAEYPRISAVVEGGPAAETGALLVDDHILKVWKAGATMGEALLLMPRRCFGCRSMAKAWRACRMKQSLTPYSRNK
jgi:C-terminal processing protease CtpA/Prc